MAYHIRSRFSIFDVVPEASATSVVLLLVPGALGAVSEPLVSACACSCSPLVSPLLHAGHSHRKHATQEIFSSQFLTRRWVHDHQKIIIHSRIHLEQKVISLIPFHKNILSCAVSTQTFILLLKKTLASFPLLPKNAVAAMPCTCMFNDCQINLYGGENNWPIY